MEEELITMKQAGKMLGICKTTLREWDNNGKLQAVRTAGGHRRYRLSDIQELQKVYQKKEVITSPPCHPDRKHFAHGFCQECYNANRNKDPKFKEWRKAYQQEYYTDPENVARHKAVQKKWNIGNHGVSQEWFDEHVAKGCAICGTFHWGSRGPCIDHDHSCCSGKYGCSKCVRGVLCSNCNRMLGSALDNTETLDKGIEYLERYSDVKYAPV